MKKFSILPQDEMSEVVAVREFSGAMTDARHKIISNYCRENSWREHCHHDWDCCGCLFMQRMEFSYERNQVIITLTQYRNY